MRQHTQVGIIGAGPAGLLLSHLLHLAGIDSVVLESRSREEVESTVRAGVLEHGTVELLKAVGLGQRMDREGVVHRGILLRFARDTHRIDFTEHTDGRSIVLYPQHEVLKDLIAARLADQGKILFGAMATLVAAIESKEPTIRFERGGEQHELCCNFVVGCDGYHSVARAAMPPAVRKELGHAYPFAWFGILVEAPPSSEELIYACHENGFALVSTRSPTLQRMYLQCDPHDEVSHWSDDRIWAELHARLETNDGWRPKVGPITQKVVVPMRSFVTEPMQHGRLFLAGDAAHIVPSTGAKGLNLAVADVQVLAHGLALAFGRRSTVGLPSHPAFVPKPGQDATNLLDRYSKIALKGVWQAEHFSSWMTSLLHRFPEADEFHRRLQLAQLDYICHSPAAARTLAESYVGLRLS